ncbi:MAG: thiol-disulfide oxidoreductase DCC family protein, partial [Rubripirellula sp.]
RRIRFTDISETGFRPEDYRKRMSDFMDEIHGRLPNGEWILGVEVFRRLYSAIGLKPIVFVTRLPGISNVLDIGYDLFAKNRLRLTGRCNADSCST